MLEEKQMKIIWICDMTCLQENNVKKKRLEKRTNYRQLAFKIRERRPGFKVKVVPLVISAFGGLYNFHSSINSFEKNCVLLSIC